MQLTIQHRGRELLHVIALLRECLRLPTATEEERRGWRCDVSRSRKDLEGLYVAGLRRDFTAKAPGGEPVISSPQDGPPPSTRLIERDRKSPATANA